MLEYLLRSALLCYNAAVEKEHAVRHLARKAHLVRYDDHRHALRSESLDNVQYLADHLGVERRGRLVKQHDIGLHAQRAYYRHTLLLTARELTRIRCGAVGKSDSPEHLHALALRLLARDMPQHHRRDGHIVEDGHVREKIEVLKNHTHLLTVEIEIDLLVGEVVALEDYLARARLFKHVETAKKGRLSRAGRTDDADDISLVYLDRNTRKHLGVSEFFVQIKNAYHSFRASFRAYASAATAPQPC